MNLFFLAYLLATDNACKSGRVFDLFNEKLTFFFLVHFDTKSFEGSSTAVEMYHHGSGFFYLPDATVAFPLLLFRKDFGK